MNARERLRRAAHDHAFTTLVLADHRKEMADLIRRKFVRFAECGCGLQTCHICTAARIADFIENKGCA